MCVCQCVCVCVNVYGRVCVGSCFGTFLSRVFTYVYVLLLCKGVHNCECLAAHQDVFLVLHVGHLVMKLSYQSSPSSTAPYITVVKENVLNVHVSC